MAFKQGKSGKWSDFFRADSQEPFEFFCEPCDVENRHIEAKGYCKNCKQFLCLDCFSSHRKPIPTRHHILLDEHQMPKDMRPTSSVSKCTEKCSKHSGELVQLFCNKHSQIGCNKCMSIDHNCCNDVHYIPSFAKGVGESRQFLQFSERLDKLEKSVDLSKETNTTNSFKINRNYENVIADIKTFRKSINSHLDKLERKLRQDAAKTKDNRVKVVGQMSKSCSEAKYKINTLRSKLQDMKKLNQEIELFVEMVKGETDLFLLEKKQEMTKTKLNVDMSSFIFITDETLVDPWEGIIRLGTILDFPIQSNIAEVKTIKVELSTEKTWVNGIVALSEQHVAYFDSACSLIKVLNTETEKVDSELDLRFKPYDITSITDSTIAVSLPENKEIVLISVHKGAHNSISLSNNKSIFMNEICKGIAYSQDKFVVACKKKVLVIDMNGNEIKSFVSNENGNALFTNIMYLTVSADNKYIYVSEEDGTVAQLSFESPIYKTRVAKVGRGISTDKFGNVYVADYSGHNIVKATAHLNSIANIQPFSTHSVSIAYSASTNKLFVGSFYEIKVFQLN